MCKTQLLIAFVFLISTNLLALDTISEIDSAKVYSVPSITVTTTKAVFGKSPVPFAEINRAEIQNRYTVQDLPSLLSGMPSIIFSSQNGNAIGYSSLTMRGFDQRRIAVLINGIPQNDPEDHQVYWINFPDIASSLDNIQVQRGAGLTNYGAAAIGGSINLTTSNFAREKGLNIQTGVGFQEYGSSGKAEYQPITSKMAVEFSSGIVDNWAFYGRLSKIESDGYRDRAWTKMQGYFFSAARFDDKFTSQLNIFGCPISDGLAYTGIPKAHINDLELRRKNPSYWMYDETGKDISYLVERRKQEIEEYSQPHFELLNDWYINDKWTFKSSLFYYQGNGFYDYDGSWADDMLTDLISNKFTITANDTLRNSIVRAYVGNKHGGWIPRLIYKHNRGELTLGAELRIHRSSHNGRIGYSEILPMDYNPDFKFYENNGEREIFSIFARERYDVNDKLTLSFEGQLVRQSYSIANEKLADEYLTHLNENGDLVGGKGRLFTINYLFFNPRVGANYILQENMNIYSMIAYTAREPRMRNLYPADDAYFGGTPLFESIDLDGEIRYDFSKPIAKPEKMLNFELGWNWVLPDYIFNANFYWMEYFDELVKSGRLDINGNPIDENAPRTRHFGLELQAMANLFDNSLGKLSVFANATISSNKIIKFDYTTVDDEIVSLAGNSIAGFPDIMGNFRINYEICNFFASFSGRHVGNFRTDNFGSLIANDERIINHLRQDYFISGYYADNLLDAYTVFDLDLSYSFKNLFSMKNLILQMQVSNVFNKLYASGAEGKDFFPAAERSIYLGFRMQF